MERKRSWEKSGCAEEEEKEEQVEQKREDGKDSQTTSYTYDDDEEKDDDDERDDLDFDDGQDYEYGDDDGKDGMDFDDDGDDDDDLPSDHNYGDDDGDDDDDDDPPSDHNYGDDFGDDDGDDDDDDDDPPSDHNYDDDFGDDDGDDDDDDEKEDWDEDDYNDHEDDDDDGDEEDYDDDKWDDYFSYYEKKDEDQQNQVSPGDTPGLWPITCGTKNGLLDVEKLKQGEKCIESEGRWFIPPAFENFGGKGTAKKWKATISHKGKSLQFWFKKGLLSTKGYKGRGPKPRKKKIPPSSSELESGKTSSSTQQQSTSSGGGVPTEESEKPSTKNTDNGDDDEGGKGTGITTQFIKKEEEEKRINDRDEGKNVTSVDAASKKQGDRLVQREMGDEDADKSADHPLSKAPEKFAWQNTIIKLPHSLSMSDGQINSMVQPTGKAEEDKYVPLSKQSKQSFATENVNTGANVAPQQLPVNQDFRDTRSITPPPNFVLDCKSESCTDVIKDERKAAHLLMTSEKCQTITDPSTTMDALMSSSSADTKVHAMDLKQLKTEKIKQQLKALKAQEKYYIKTTYMQLKALKAQEEYYKRTQKMKLKAIKAQEEYYISKLKDLEDHR